MLILFDLDNTLLDDSAAMRAAIEDMQPKLNPHQDKQVFLDDWIHLANTHYRKYLAGEVSLEEQRRGRMKDISIRALSDTEADNLTTEFLQKYEDNWRLYDDAVECLDELENFTLGIVTNGPKLQQIKKLEKCHIFNRFDFTLSSQEFGYPKPDARIFLHACQKADADPAEVFYVGDNYEVDALGSSQAGLKSIWLNRSDLQIEDMPHAIKAITGLRNLKSIIGI